MLRRAHDPRARGCCSCQGILCITWLATRCPSPADQLAWTRARRPQSCKLATRPALRAIVGEKLKQQQWSPQQIAGWLKTTYPDNLEMQVSHETIYRTLFIQSRGA